MTNKSDPAPGWITLKVQDVAADIPTMRDMDAGFYAAYVEETLFFVDHHDVLRSNLGEYPIATSEKQVRLLIEYLEGVAQRMKEAE